MLGFVREMNTSSKVISGIMSLLVVLSAVFVQQHETFVSIAMSLCVLSLMYLVVFLQSELSGLFKMMGKIYEKPCFIEARLDAQAPAPSDILRHVTQWFCDFDSRRGGSEIFKEHLWRLKSSLMSAPWAKHFTPKQMAAEWNFFVAAAA